MESARDTYRKESSVASAKPPPVCVTTFGDCPRLAVMTRTRGPRLPAALSTAKRPPGFSLCRSICQNAHLQVLGRVLSRYNQRI